MKHLLLFVLLGCFVQLNAQNIIYVDSAATGQSNGTSWVNAYPDLHVALRLAQPGEQVWVAKGTYRPTHDTTDAIPVNEKDKVFFINNDSVQVYGGFAGYESHLNQRKWRENPSILSAKLLNDTNCYSVFVSVGQSRETRLDGFYVQDAFYRYAASLQNGGGGITLYNSSISLVNLFVRQNISESGTAFRIWGDSLSISKPSLINIIIAENSLALNDGTCLYVWKSNVYIQNLVMQNNTYTSFGIKIYNSKVVIHNLTNDGNTAVSPHLGLTRGYLSNDSEVQIYNSILRDPGDRLPSKSTDPLLSPTIYNSIVRNSWPGYQTLYEAIGLDGGGNILTLPLYRFEPQDYRLASCSPGIDVGQSSYLPYDSLDLDYDGITNEPFPVDLAGNPRVSGSDIDMGAYEYQPFPGGVDSSYYYLCSGQSSINIKGENFGTSGNYSRLYSSREGCDSAVFLMIRQQSADTAVQRLSDSSLVINTSPQSIQWYDCDNDSLIPGATDSLFMGPTGRYAVIVTNNGCVDTSGCYSIIDPIGLEQWQSPLAKIYPNPSSGIFHLDFYKNITGTLHLYDLQGRQIKEQSLENKDVHRINLNEFPKGVYLLILRGTDFYQTYQLIKQ